MKKEELSNLKDIANILRRDFIESTTEAQSGHPTSCLSCAEILPVLFFSEMKYDISNPENPNNDEFILSKGHAAPILYSALHRAGCIPDELNSLRKLSSRLEGHPIPSSLPWIKVATGSLGQGLSAGIGFALAAKLQKRKYRTFVLLGDSELSEGSIYEALQLAPEYKLNNLIAIADINRLGQTGPTMLQHNLSDYKSRISSFGWSVVSINGHSLPSLKKALSSTEKTKPTFILAKTFKGQGVSFLKNKENWHGRALTEKEKEKAFKELPNPKMPKIKIKKPSPKKYKPRISRYIPNTYQQGTEVATRDAYGKALSSLAKSDSRIIALDAEVSNSTHSEFVKKTRPKQFIETYIAEQDMIGISLGLSKKGFKPFASTFSAFLSRAHDQLRMASLSDANLVISGSHSGVSVGEDGASQMGLEDIAIFRDLINSTVLYPSDAVPTEALMQIAYKNSGITYIRTTRPKTKVLYSSKEKFPLGQFKILRSSSKDSVVLAGAGITLHEALKAHALLKSKYNLNTAVIDLYCIKPFNSKALISFVKKHGNKIITAEDHYQAGGIGEMLAEAVENTSIKVKHLFVSDKPHSGTTSQLLEKHKINWQHIALNARLMK